MLLFECWDDDDLYFAYSQTPPATAMSSIMIAAITGASSRIKNPTMAKEITSTTIPIAIAAIAQRTVSAIIGAVHLLCTSRNTYRIYLASGQQDGQSRGHACIPCMHVGLFIFILGAPPCLHVLCDC